MSVIEHPSSPHRDEPLAVAVEVGATTLAFALVDRAGRVQYAFDFPTPKQQGADAVSERVIAGIELARGEARVPVLGVGIGIPGVVDKATGMVVDCLSLGWRDYPLAARLREGLALPFRLEETAVAATLAEIRFGHGRDRNCFVHLILGTGVSMAVVLGGQVWAGEHGCAGLLGDCILEPGGRLCRCGRRGCIEAYISGAAIAEQGQKQSPEDPVSRILLLAGGNVGQITARTVFEAARLRDAVASRIVRDVGERLGRVIGWLVNILDIRLFVLGGGVAQASDLLIPIASEAARDGVRHLRLGDFEIRPSALGQKAGLIGAAATIFDGGA